MAIQIMSDLHLEAPKAYDIFEIVPKAPVLALLGDIGNVEAHKSDMAGFIARQLRQFRAVLYVPGNHEAYQSTWPATLRILMEFEKEVRAQRAKDPALGGFVLLDRTAYRLQQDLGVVVLGCSLFSHVPPEAETAVSQGMNDFYQDANWTVAEHNAAHKRDLVWLNGAVEELGQLADVHSIIIMTHWSPSTDPRAQNPRYANDPNPIAAGFRTDLSREACFQAPKVKVWAFGHTHYNCDFVVERGSMAGPLRLVTNQRGYYFAQSQGYGNDKTLKV
ncbi:hypothetical protein SPI_01858 [Niveomyces insectorum RCEF 264]|uniref:Calcineurin-like phosphoesterase domain-containing protein n=1 Tax=Niveomyces insectorum RCEF 264 TaxID=1081102 RepID=A0A162JDB7_9HYPO|nr:hypothetical protein SPI_01858 [Niveomyces insectorum RCEF 264]